MREPLFAFLVNICLLTIAQAAVFRLDYSSGQSARVASSRAAMTSASAGGLLRSARLSPGRGSELGCALRTNDVLEVTLFEDCSFALTLGRSCRGCRNVRAFLGTDAAGEPTLANAVVLQTAEGLQLMVDDYRHGRTYSVVSDVRGISINERRTDGVRACATRSPSVRSRPNAAIARTEVPAVAEESFVDVLVAYDSDAENWVAPNGGMRNFAELAIQRMNMALFNSGLSDTFSFRLAGTLAIGASAGGDLNDALDAAVDRTWLGGGDWGILAQKRDECGADVVTILVDTGSDSGLVGLGMALQDEPISDFSELAYNVCAIQSVAVVHTMTHEVGHNMGAGHADATFVNRWYIDPGPQLWRYSSGFHFEADGTPYHTIMSYDTDGWGRSYEEAPVFSSPEVVYRGVVAGDASHDNVRTLAGSWRDVSQFRQAIVDPGSVVDPDPDDRPKPEDDHDPIVNPDPGTDPEYVYVSFDGNGGSVREPFQYVKVGNLWGKMQTPTRQGFVFIGWYTEPEGGFPITASTAIPPREASYYAHWTPILSLAAALDGAGLDWASDSWHGQSVDSHDGRSAVRCGSIRNGQSTYLRTLVRGEGELCFWWKCSCERDADVCLALIDGLEVGHISGERDWASASVSIRGDGLHQVEWIYKKNASVTKGQDAAWVDQVVWRPTASSNGFVCVSYDGNGGSVRTPSQLVRSGNLWGKMQTPTRGGYMFVGWYTDPRGGVLVTSSSPVPDADVTYYARWTPILSLAAALDGTGLDWVSDSWHGQSVDSHDGVSAVRCGSMCDGQQTYLQTSVSGPGRISFFWKCSCEWSGNDALRFLVDGVQQAMITGESDWAPMSVDVLGGGRHALKWVYRKNGSVTKGQDAAWVDRVLWERGTSKDGDRHEDGL